MSESVQQIILLSIYRSITMVIGLAVIYLGYRLFCLGVYEKAGELKAAWGNKNLTLKQTAPGTFFALFGVLIIAFSIWRGFKVDGVDGAAAVGLPGAKSTGHISLSSLTEVDPILQKVISQGQISEEERELLNKWLIEEKIRVMRQRIELPVSRNSNSKPDSQEGY